MTYLWHHKESVRDEGRLLAYENKAQVNENLPEKKNPFAT